MSSPPESREKIDLFLAVNGAPTRLAIEARATLLDVLRDRLHLTGTKRACDHGQCGACTVLVNGRRVLSCLALAALHDSADVTTIEGLAIGGELHPVQQAFLDHDALQCGACTPGQIMSAFALLREPVGDDDESLQDAMSGNLCRCGAYRNILAAVRQVRDQAARRQADHQQQQQGQRQPAAQSASCTSSA